MTSCIFLYSLDVFALDDIIADKSFDRLTVENIDNRIAEHEAQILKHQRAVAKYKGHRNTLTDTITSKLPIEIFSDILLRYASMCRDPKELFHGKRHYLWVKILHISRRWRNIACSTPMLFSHIRVCDQPHDAELAKHFLHFSGQTALHLQTELYGRSKANREELSALLSNHAHRIATMCSNRHLMVEIYHSMNNLRSIEIRPGNFHQTRSENFIKYPLPSSLTRLIFTSEAFSHTSPQEFLSAIGGLSLLQELQIVDPLLSEAWRYLPHTTVGPLKTVILTGSTYDVLSLLWYITVAVEGSLCIKVESRSSDDLCDLLHEVNEKLFSTPSPLDVIYSMWVGTSLLEDDSFEYSIGDPESVTRKSIISGNSNIAIDLDNPPTVYPRFHLHLVHLRRKNGLVASYPMETIGDEFSTAFSATTRFVVDIHRLRRSVVGELLEKSENLTTLELLSRCNFSRVVKTLRWWFLDFSGVSSSGIFPLLHTLVISHTSDEVPVAIGQAISSLYDILRIRKESGLAIQTLVVDFSASRFDAPADLQQLIEELQDVALEFSYLPSSLI